jgi:G3E family GTPase
MAPHCHRWSLENLVGDFLAMNAATTPSDGTQYCRSSWENLVGELMKEKGNDLYRYKGILSVAGKDEKFVFQGVHMLFDGAFHKPWGKVLSVPWILSLHF